MSLMNFVKTSALLCLLACCGCAGLGARAAAPVVGPAAVAFEKESDPVFARDALPGQIKLLEGLLESAPGNAKLNRDAARGLFAYAFLFIEDEDPARASTFYLRARKYSLAGLGLDEKFCDLPEAEFLTRLSKISKSKSELLFWLGATWSGWLNLNMSEPAAISQLSNLRTLLGRIVELCPEYYFGMPYVLMGALEGNLPRMFGGRTEYARECFERALEISSGRLLVARFMFARYYAVAAQDVKLFDEQLTAVADAAPDILPEQRLMNTIVKQKAAALVEERGMYFLEGDD